jgi:lauroyl/myristoyl acyltransferase
MSIGSYLLTKERLELVKKKSWKFGRVEIIEQGMRYYDEHPEDVSRIQKNLEYMGLANQGAALDDVLREIAVHYFEKLFVMVKTYEAFWIAKNRIEMGESLNPFVEARETGKAVFVGQSHFGATYLMGIALTARGIDLNVVGNFPEPAGGMIKQTNDAIVEKYGAGSATLINLAQGDVDVPMEMMRLIMTGKVVSNVYDENNKFCKPVELLGRKIMGGTGMDLILRNFNDEKVVVVTPFLVRTSDETFRYELDRHELKSADIIKSFYRSLEKRIKAHCEQWYFIHELHHSFSER